MDSLWKRGVNSFVRVARHQELRDQPSPTGLMGRADAAAGVAVEILVEQQVIAEIWIPLHARVMAEYRPLALLVLQKDPREPHGELVGHVVDRDERARSRRAFDAKVVTVVVMKLLQRFDDEKIHGHPDRTAPVGVAAE